MTTVIIFPRGQLSEWDKDQALAAGIVVLEADEPEKVVQMIPSATMPGADDLLMSALHACRYGSEGQRFTNELHARLIKREQATTPPALASGGAGEVG